MDERGGPPACAKPLRRRQARLRPFAAAGLRRLGQVAVLLLVAFVAAAALLALGFGGEAVWRRLAALSPGLVVGLLGLSLVNYAARGWRWLVFSRRLGLAVPAARGVLYFVAGFAFTATPGKVGEGLRLWLIERSYGYGYARLAPLFVGDRLSDLHGIVLLCLAGAAGLPSAAGPAAVVAGAVLLLTAGLVHPRPLRRLVGAVHAVAGGRASRLFARLRMALQRCRRLFAADVYPVALLLSVVGWSAEAAAFYWLLDALGAPVPPLQAAFVFGFSIAVGALTLLPGGLGGTEATMLGLLLALGVDSETALVATAVIRVTTLWFGVGLGFAALPFALRHARRDNLAAAWR